MRLLSLFLVFSCLLSRGVLCANNHHACLGGEDASIKGADASSFVAFEKQAPDSIDHESPPSKSKTSSPPSPPSNLAKPFPLDEKFAMEGGFAFGVFEKPSEMIKEEGFDQVKGGGRIGTQQVKETWDLVVDKGEQVGRQGKDDEKEGFDEVKGGKIGTQKVKETGDFVVDKFDKANDDEKATKLKEKSTIGDKTKQAWAITKEELEKAAEVVAEKVPRCEKEIERIKKVGLDMQKIHNTVWDDRSAKTKITGFFTELLANFTYLSKRALEPTMGAFQLLALSNANGINILVCFFASSVLVGSLSTHQYVTVQNMISPIYIRTLVGSIGFSLLARCLRSFHFGLHSFQVYIMLLSLCLILINRFYISPRVTKIWLCKMNLETWMHKMNLEKGDGKVWGRRRIRVRGMQFAVFHTKDTFESQYLKKLERQLKFMKALSHMVDVVTLIALATQVACIGNSLSTV